MGKDWRELLQRDAKGPPKEKQRLVLMILCGVLLFIIASPGKGSLFERSQSGQRLQGLTGGQSTTSQGAGGGQPTTQGGAGGQNFATGMGTGQGMDPQAYVESLEKRLSERLSKINGVGAVEVMISLQSSEELVVEKEQSAQRNTTNETDAGGGKRVVNEQTTQESTVYTSEGGDKQPLVVKTIVPQVQGVLVVAKGAGSGNVNRTIVEIAQALFGLEAHKVKVVKME